MSLFDGCHDLIDKHLSLDETWAGTPPRHKSETSLNHMGDGNLPDGVELISELYNLMMLNWESENRPTTRSRENWRFTRHPEFQDVGKRLGPEVALERTIIQVVDHENWANQIPVDSGLLGPGAKTLDLAFRAGSVFELIELKAVDGDTPLSAAFQVLLYGLAYAFFRNNFEELGIGDLQSPLLNATTIRLRVLAPAANYERFDRSWLPWLRELEARLDKGVQEFSDSAVLLGVKMKLSGFQFDVFPEDFHWDQTRHSDDDHRREVLVAVHRRHPYFGQ